MNWKAARADTAAKKGLLFSTEVALPAEGV